MLKQPPFKKDLSRRQIIIISYQVPFLMNISNDLDESRIGRMFYSEPISIIIGMWTACLHPGNFFGSLVGGIAVEAWGFRKASYIYWATYLSILVRNILP